MDETALASGLGACSPRAQRKSAAGGARVGRLDRGGMDALRRARSLRLQHRRSFCGRHRRPRPDAPGCASRPLRGDARGPLPARTLPRCRLASRVGRARRLGRRLLRQPQRADRFRTRRRRRRHVDDLQAGSPGNPALACPDSARADRLQRRDLDV